MPAEKALTIVLVPGLVCTARLYADQNTDRVPSLWRFGSVTLADHTHNHSIAAIARRALRHRCFLCSPVFSWAATFARKSRAGPWPAG
jgi:hypothetical protein